MKETELVQDNDNKHTDVLLIKKKSTIKDAH